MLDLLELQCKNTGIIAMLNMTAMDFTLRINVLTGPSRWNVQNDVERL